MYSLPPSTIGLSTLTSLIDPKGIHLLAFGYLYGVNVWQTFAGGIIAFRSLPRSGFRTLQHNIFPVYFATNLGASALLLFLHTLYSSSLTPAASRNLTTTLLGFSTALHGLNLLVAGPATTKIMLERARQEKDDGRGWDDKANASPQMKKLNKRFGMVHGISSLLNLFALITITIHGLWLGKYGLDY